MIKTDWTAEEVWDEADRAGDHSGLAQQMLTYLAERIEAGESAVTDEVVQIAVRAFRKAFATDGVSGLKKITFDAMRTTLLAVWPHPPAQPAKVDKCCCGEPSVSGVRHRLDGPCYLSEKDADAPPAQPAQVENPDDLNGDPSGEWYCEEHPQFLQSHDNCGGAGIPSCARIPCLMHQIRQLEQRNRELVHQYGFLADLATLAQTVDVEAVREVIGEMKEWLLPLDIGDWRTKLSQAIGDKT